MVYQEEKNAPIYAQSESSEYQGWKFWKRRRYVVATLAFFGFFNVYALRANLSIAIVDMTELKNITLANGTIILEREFDWDTKLQGYILSAFFYGYITTQLLGGYLAAKFGGKRIFGIGISVTAALTLITPWLARIDVMLLLAVRVIEGIFEGVTYPCIHGVWSKWAPPLERSRLATIAFSGSYVGTVVAMPVCSALTQAFGWPSIFYCFGAIGLIWFMIWMIVVADTPDEDSRISPEEFKYIKDSLGANNNKVCNKLPWKAVVTSLPVWAIVTSHFCESWGFFTLLTQLPKFMKYVLEFDLNATGIMSALPYLAMAIMVPFSGQIADWTLVKGFLTTTQVRKLFNCGAFLAQTVFMMSAAFWLSPIGTTFCLTMAVGLGAFALAGFCVNHLDIAPQHASILMGISNTFGTVPGMVSPILTGYIVTNESSADEWRSVFYISSGIYLFGAVVYGFFASGEIQWWAIEREPLKNSHPVGNGGNKSNDPAMNYENKSFPAESSSPQKN